MKMGVMENLRDENSNGADVAYGSHKVRLK